MNDDRDIGCIVDYRRCCMFCINDSRQPGSVSVTVGDAASQKPDEGAAAMSPSAGRYTISVYDLVS